MGVNSKAMPIKTNGNPKSGNNNSIENLKFVKFGNLKPLAAKIQNIANAVHGIANKKTTIFRKNAIKRVVCGLSHQSNRSVKSNSFFIISVVLSIEKLLDNLMI